MRAQPIPVDVRPPPKLPVRAGMGSFLRAILEFLDQEGLREQVRARVSPETSRLMQAPPWPLAWVDARHIDEIEVALHRLLGAAGCADLGMFVARRLGAGFVQPVIRAAFFLFGEEPPSIFSNLDRFFMLMTRGIAFASRPLDQKTWVIEATLAGGDVPAAALHVLRGSLQYVFELTSSRGQVGGAEIRRQTAGSTVVAFQVCLES